MRGPATLTRVILIDGKPLEIRENLWQFLNIWACKLPQIFIDQICIDQKNAFEKYHQIALMDDIYYAAYELHVWLGPTSAYSNKAMRFLRSPSRRSWTPTIKRSLYALFSRSCWAHLWIVQEIILGSRADKMRVFCGCDWISTAQLRNVFLATTWGLQVPATTYHLLELVDKKSWPNLDRNELQSFLSCNCTYIVEKVYGLQGLLHPKHRLPVDYQISPDELFFRSFTISLQEAHQKTEDGKSEEINWKLFVNLLETLGSALELEFPPAVVMDLVLTEMKIVGIRYLDHKQIAQVARELRPVLSNNTKVEDTYWNFKAWVSPPSYLAIRSNQRLRYSKSWKTTLVDKLWPFEREPVLEKNVLSHLRWNSRYQHHPGGVPHTSGPRPRLRQCP